MTRRVSLRRRLLRDALGLVAIGLVVAIVMTRPRMGVALIVLVIGSLLLAVLVFRLTLPPEEPR